MENKCQRCFTKKAIFNCPSCEKIHNFCQNCDDYIHSLKQNKYHKRYYLNLSNEIIDNNSILGNSQNENNNILNSQLNISNNSKNQFNTYPINNININDNYLSTAERENKNQSLYKFQSYYNTTKSNNSNNNLNLSNNNIKINQNYKFNNNSSGIKSIKNQIEYIQKNMSDQVSQILQNIDNNNQSMNYDQQLEQIEKNYQEQIRQLMEIKNKEIDDLERELKEANKTNENLLNEISNANEDNNIKVIELTNIINSLTDEYNHKEEQILMIKGKSSKKTNFLENEIIEEKNMICSDYEKKINNILNISEHNQKKLMDVIREKDIIIQNLINCNQNKNKAFNEFVNKIDEDNKKLKNITEQSIGLSKYNLFNSKYNINANDYANYSN